MSVLEPKAQAQSQAQAAPVEDQEPSARGDAAAPCEAKRAELAEEALQAQQADQQTTASKPELPLDYPRWLIQELRSDQAGEVGAVMIYRGILAVSRDSTVRKFAEHHLQTERKHLAEIDALLPRAQRSRLLPLWRIAGVLTGALPALFGAKAVYATIEAVETFVDHHYATQIARLDAEQIFPSLRATLNQCRLDEVAHRDEAKGNLTASPGPLLSAWCRAVGSGSALAVGLAKRF